MHFYRKKGQQVLDLSGDLILTDRSDLVTCKNKSAGPRHIINPLYVLRSRQSFRSKCRATWAVLKYIWRGKPR